MPTELPPDYKPKPVRDPHHPGDNPVEPGAPGEDSPGAPGRAPGGVPQPGPGVGVPGPGPDVVDPPGWAEPPLEPGGFPSGVPTPAGTPSF